MTSVEFRVERMCREMGMRTYQQERRSWCIRRTVCIALMILTMIIVGVALAWLAPSLIHTFHQTQAGASLLRQTISKVGG